MIVLANPSSEYFIQEIFVALKNWKACHRIVEADLYEKNLNDEDFTAAVAPSERNRNC